MQIVHSALMIFYPGFWKNHLKFREYKFNSSFLGNIMIYWDLSVNSVFGFAENIREKLVSPVNLKKANGPTASRKKITQFIEQNHPLKKPPQPLAPELKVTSNTTNGNVILGARRWRKNRRPKDHHVLPDSIPGLGPRGPNSHTTALVLSLGDDLPSSSIRGRQHEEAKRHLNSNVHLGRKLSCQL